MKVKIGLIGSGGLIGKAILKTLKDEYDFYLIKSNNLYQTPEKLAPLLNDLNIIINFSGFPIAGRWSRKRKKLIYDSRIITSQNLIKAIGLLKIKPGLLINASAIGLYADAEASADENTINFADNFLAHVVLDWENEVSKVIRYNTNLTILRLGVVLSGEGGAYPKIRRIFKLGIGGRIGSGRQGFSYILIDDLVGIIDFVIKNNIFGIVNAVSPVPVTNHVFTAEISKVFHRPSFFIIPAFILKLIYGEGSIILLEGQKVLPARLIDYGYKFVGNNLLNCLNLLEK